MPASFEIVAMDLAHLDALVRLHTATFAGTAGVALGRTYVKRFIAWFIHYPQAIKLVCIVDGDVVGYVFGAPSDYHTALNRDLFWTVAVAYVTHPWLVLRRDFRHAVQVRFLSMLTRRSKAPAAPTGAQAQPDGLTFRLTAIGVSPTMRKRNIGVQLVKAYEQAVWHAGGREIQLSVYRSNAAARRLYEKCEWVLLGGDDILTYSRRYSEA